MLKNRMFCFFLILPQFMIAQHVVTLTVVQPPEFGFSVSGQDTTILKGSSVVLGNGLVISGGSGEYSFRWSPGSSLSDSLILHPVASPADTTLYLLTVTDQNGCSFSLSYKVNVKSPPVKSDLIRGKPDLDALIFPNPGKGSFRVKLSGAPAWKIDLDIMDDTGKILKSAEIINFTGDHTELFQLKGASGVYHLRIKSNATSIVRPVIIH